MLPKVRYAFQSDRNVLTSPAERARVKAKPKNFDEWIMRMMGRSRDACAALSLTASFPLQAKVSLISSCVLTTSKFGLFQLLRFVFRESTLRFADTVIDAMRMARRTCSCTFAQARRLERPQQKDRR